MQLPGRFNANSNEINALKLVLRLLYYSIGENPRRVSRPWSCQKLTTEQFSKQKSRRNKVGRRMRRLAALVLVLALACAVDWFVSHRRHSAALQSSHSGASAPTDSLLDSNGTLPLAVHAERSLKVVYPYSVIPGGAHSIEELKNAIAKDPVVAAQYAAFHLDNARIIQLDRDRTMHVSYRRGDDLFWTQRELKLAKGETLITDGTETALARCGNMLAEAFLEPSSPDEPTAQELNTPVPNNYGPVELESDNRFPEIQPVGSSYVPPVGEGFHPVGGSGPSTFLPSGPAGPSPFGGAHTPPLVVKTPEPGTGILLVAGLLALFFMQKRKTKNVLKNVS
jgi:hypothetical protein